MESNDVALGVVNDEASIQFWPVSSVCAFSAGWKKEGTQGEMESNDVAKAAMNEIWGILEGALARKARTGQLFGLFPIPTPMGPL